MKTIMAATDLSHRSEPALDRAETIARATGAELLIVHAVDDDQPGRVVQGLVGEAEELLRAEVERRPGIRASARILTGDVYRVLASFAGDAGAELVVVGDHRRDPLRDVFHDTTVERVVRVSPAPVLVARLPGATRYRRAVIGVESEEAPELVKAIVSLGEAAPNKLTAVTAFGAPAIGLLAYAGTDRDEIDRYRKDLAGSVRQRLASSLPQGAAPQPEVRVSEAEPAEALEQVAREEGCELIAVSTHARRGVLRRIVGSVSSNLLRHGSVDLLVVPRRPL